MSGAMPPAAGWRGLAGLASLALGSAMLVSATRVEAIGAAEGAGSSGRSGTLTAIARSEGAGAANSRDAAAPRTIRLAPETERAWQAYVAATERRREAELKAAGDRFLVQDFARDPRAGERLERDRALAGEVPLVEMQTRDANRRAIDVPDALVSHWRGTILLPGVTLDELWTRLQQPNERGPFQPDVLALRVLAREPEALTLFIKMTRTKLVTVTYDTEHRVTFHRDRVRPTRAWSRSEATRITEVARTASGAERDLPADEEHGFLWRLHAYWRYEQLPAGVLVELESLTLSRDIPFGFGAIVGPIVDRIARESMTRTLGGIRTEYGRPPRPARMPPGGSGQTAPPAAGRS